MEKFLSEEQKKRYFWDFLTIFAGSTIVAFGTQYIFDPAGLVTGGVSGLAIAIKFLTGTYTPYEVPLWLSNLVLNIPIFLFALKTDGIRSIIRTGIGWLIMTVELYLFPVVHTQPQNLLLVAVYGGIAYGLGTGLLLSARATTGGTDMLGNSLHKYFRQYSMGRIIQILDGAVVVLGAVVFNLEHTLYAIISVYIMGKVTDYVLGRGKSAKIALIISNCNEQIASDILVEMDRGVTGLKGKGMYSGEDRTILVCICSNKDIVLMKEIVRKYDPKAFFVVGSVNEAMGEGFVESWV
ncbi:MAG: YitT family protein [Lachnospiraceae bacterium]|nr:YitT family protein [Lachnospiraceae bacterium]